MINVCSYIKTSHDRKIGYFLLTSYFDGLISIKLLMDKYNIDLQLRWAITIVKTIKIETVSF